MCVCVWDMKKKKNLPQSKSVQEKQKENVSSICLNTADKGEIWYLASWNGLFLRWGKFIQFQSHLAKHVGHIFMREFNQIIQKSQTKNIMFITTYNKMKFSGIKVTY